MATISNNTLFFNSLQFKNKPAADYSASFVPLAGEFCIESDTKKAKLGDGATTWSELGYYLDPISLEARLQAVEAFDTRITALEDFKAAFDAITTISANPAPASSGSESDPESTGE